MRVNRDPSRVVLVRLAAVLAIVLAALAACGTPQPGPVVEGVTGEPATLPPTAAASPTAESTPTPELSPTPAETATPTPGPDLAELLQTPQAAYLNADLAGAREGFAELAELYPASAEPWIGQAAVAQREGDVDAALGLLEEAVAVEPGSFEAWRQLAVIYEQRQDHENAANAYGALIGIAPDDPNLYVARAMSLARLGRAEEAAADLVQAQALDPYRDYAWLNVAGAAYGSRSYQTAADILSGGIEAYPGAVGLLVMRGRANLAAGNPDAALADFDAAAAADPNSMAAHYGRGAALDALGRADEAVAAYQQAGDIGASAGAGGLWEGFEAMSQAARIMARTDAGRAYAYLQEKAVTYGQPPPILFGYALIEYERGNATAALDNLNRLIELFNYLPAYYWRGKINAEIGSTGAARGDLEWYLDAQQAGPEAEDAYAVLESLGS
jgi:tetratricopeptide (TPR) repeat protein